LITIGTYNSNLKQEWDRFVKNAKNYHFFFQRDYMEYHSDRFDDFSLMVYKKKKLIALLPANIKGSTLYSHQGLTFGGFIVNDNMKVVIMLEIFKKLQTFLHEHDIHTLIYKTIPYIYHIKAAEEDRYALFVTNARCYRVDVVGTIYLQEKVKYSNGRKWSINKAKRECLTIEHTRDITPFWALLETVLQEQHSVQPVHSLKEMLYLISLFPKNIHLFLCKKDNILLSGALIYENQHIAHLQYVANSKKGKEIGALDFLVDHLLKNIYQDKKYFDFGNSNEENGRVLNTGLMDQKERFDARATVQEFYEITIR